MSDLEWSDSTVFGEDSQSFVGESSRSIRIEQRLPRETSIRRHGQPPFEIDLK